MVEWTPLAAPVFHSALCILTSAFPPMKLLVGLGNPGSAYVGTRHNVGFEVVDAIAERLGWVNSPGAFDRLAKSRFDGLAMDGSVQRTDGTDERLLLLKPMTFMNVSGQAVQAAMAFHKLSPADLVVALDDLALPCGTIRLRGGGSSGGHNGLKDIQRVLGTDQYPRLRLGIDPTPPRMAGKDYVLGKFTAEQRDRLAPALGRAAGAIVPWVDKGIGPAMSQFNADVT
jgi:PTH1 family peptidyl-tRNA hydrolase